MAPANSVYLDFNASTPVLPTAAAAATATFEILGNPSSVHGFGRRARALVEDAREAVAAMVGAAPAGVIFTSGAAEANALALRGITGANNCQAILASAVEHPSVLAHVPAENLIAVNSDGVVDLGDLERRLTASKAPALVALMLANNETGAIQPVAQAAEIVHRHGGFLHCDAVQGPGKLELDMTALGADSLCLSAHKFGGLKGAGALVLRPGLEISALLPGGGQERRRRGGTENVAGIAALGAAAGEEAHLRAAMTKVATLRDELESSIRKAAPRARVFSADVPRLGNTTNLVLPGVTSEAQIMRLDLAGVAISGGAACSSGKIAASHVLLAMGVAEKEARCGIRISLGWSTPREDVARFLGGWTPLASGAAA